MSKEAKIGLIVVLSLLITLLLLPGFHKRPAVLGYSFNLLFTNIAGVRIGDPVKIGGVPAGIISDIAFASDKERRMFASAAGDKLLIRVTVTLNHWVKIPENSSYEAVSNLKGEHWINITPGSGDTYLSPGDSYLGKSRSRREDQLSATIHTFRRLSEQTARLRSIISDPKLRTQIKDTASNFRFYSREMKRVSIELTRPGGTLDQFESQIDEEERSILERLDRWNHQISYLQTQIALWTPKLHENIAAWNQKLTHNQAQLTDIIQKALNYSERFNASVSKIEASYGNKKQIKQLVIQIKRIRKQLDNIADIATDLHNLSSNKTLRKRLKNMITQLKQRSAALKEKLDKLEQTLNKIPINIEP